MNNEGLISVEYLWLHITKVVSSARIYDGEGEKLHQSNSNWHKIQRNFLGENAFVYFHVNFMLTISCWCFLSGWNRPFHVSLRVLPCIKAPSRRKLILKKKYHKNLKKNIIKYCPQIYLSSRFPVLVLVIFLTQVSSMNQFKVPKKMTNLSPHPLCSRCF